MFKERIARKTAVLCPLERFDHVKFFALCSERHSIRIRAFVTYEQAMDWLTEDDQHVAAAAPESE